MKRSYYIKLLLSAALFSIVPVTLSAGFLYAKSATMVEEYLSSRKAKSLALIQHRIENRMETVDHAATHLFQSALFRQTMDQPLSGTQFDVYGQLRQELNHLQRYDTGIVDIAVYNHAQGWLVNNQGLLRTERIEDVERYEALLAMESRSGWLLSSNAAYAADPDQVNRSCPQHLNLIKKLPLHYAAGHTGVAVISIPVCELQYILQEDEWSGESLMIADAGGNLIVYGSGGSLPGDGMDPPGWAGAFNSSDGSGGQFRDEGGNRTVTYQKSHYSGWTYISIMDQGEIRSGLLQVAGYTAAICAGVLAAALLGGWLWAARLYAPVRRMFRYVGGEGSSLPDQKGGRDEFDYVVEKFDVLSRSAELLQGRLVNQDREMRRFFTLKLIQGEASRGEIERRLQTAGLSDGRNRLAVMVIRLQTLDATRFGEEDRDLILFAVSNIVEELIPAASRLDPVIWKQQQVTALFGPEETDEAFVSVLEELGSRVSEHVIRYLGIQVEIGFSDVYTRPAQIHQAYRNAAEALKYKLLAGEEPYVFYSRIPKGSRLASYPGHLEKELATAMESADEESSASLVEQMVREIVNSNPGTQDYQLSIVRLYTALGKLMHASGVKLPDNHTGGTIVEEVLSQRTMENTVIWFKKNMVIPFIHHELEVKQSQSTLLAKKMIGIIHGEYDTDLTIEVCAERLHYSASYLSAVFRKEMDIPFSGYLNNYRHEMAKKWLLETEMSVREISRMLRYTNPQNFIRNFRRIEGVTPGKYKEMCQAGWKSEVREAAAQG